MPTLAAQIRAHINNGAQLFDSDRALLAVVDKCEQMRAEFAGVSEFFVGPFQAAVASHQWADEFEHVIARELGINPEES